MNLLYLASPYSHPDPAVRESRYRSACEYAAILMRYGHAVFAPIAHSHPIAAHLPEELVCNHEFWMGQDLPVLSRADKLVVLTLEGWQESRGVQEEIMMAREWETPIEYHGPAGVVYPDAA